GGSDLAFIEWPDSPADSGRQSGVALVRPRSRPAAVCGGRPLDQPRRPDCLRPIAGTDATPRWPTGNLANWDDHPTRFLTRLHAGPSGLTAADGGSGQSQPGDRTITARSASGRSL